MLFNSLEFALFFPITVVAYFSLAPSFRWALLLGASCLFYMAAVPAYILVLAFTITVDYFAGIFIAQATGRTRRLWLAASIVTNVATLAFFKYFDFALATASPLVRLLGFTVPPSLGLVLPIGLSFHTFQAMSYTIDVYRGHYPAERHFGVFALYVMFFPQLVAGPIERPMHLIRQFYDRPSFDAARVNDGIRLMAWGLFKKVVIADRLALIVNRVYESPSTYAGPALAVATVAFAYQIYCDFSGYTDLARGSARVLGFDLRPNFASPYAARSVSEFWRRWHMSLSSWFRDYLYIPLGGNRVGVSRHYANIAVTFLVSGLWHGANWTFVIWGALHGLFLLTSLSTSRLRGFLSHISGLERLSSVRTALRVVLTFTLVTYAWVWFRAANVDDAMHISRSLFSGWPQMAHDIGRLSLVFGTSGRELIVAVAAVALLEVVQFFQRRGVAHEWVRRQPAWRRWALYYATAATIVLFGVFDGNKFIYFQF